MQRKMKKLALTKVTVRSLETLANVQGGGGPLSDTLCQSTCTPCPNELPQPTAPEFCQ